MKTYKIIELLADINWEKYFVASGFAPHFASIANVQGCDVVRANWLTDFKEEDRLMASEAMQLLKETYRLLALLDRDYEVFTEFIKDSSSNKCYIIANASAEIALLFENDAKKKDIVQKITFALVNAATVSFCKELNKSIINDKLNDTLTRKELIPIYNQINLDTVEIKIQDCIYPNYAQLTEIK